MSSQYHPTDPTERAIYKALSYAPALSPSDVGAVEMMMQGGEWELAFEVMCTQIDESTVPADRAGIEFIEQLGRELGVDPRYSRWVRKKFEERAAGDLG